MPGKAEQCLGDERAAEQRSEVEAEHGHDRREGPRSPCLKITRRSGMPFARAVRM
jgi:hypothetical protein